MENLIQEETGFTLVEIMVVVAILAIMAAVAVGIYQPYVNRTKCSDVETAVHETMMRATQYVAENNSAPPGTAAALGVTLPSSVSSVVVGGSGTTANPITVNGTATGNKCTLGTKYVLTEDDTKGTWK